MSIDGIIKNEKRIYDLQTTTLYGMKVHIAETKEGKIGYVKNPEKYSMIGRDGDFRPVYELRK